MCDFFFIWSILNFIMMLPMFFAFVDLNESHFLDPYILLALQISIWFRKIPVRCLHVIQNAEWGAL